MIAPDIPADEGARLDVLHGLHILDTAPERAYDDLLRIAAAICHVPMGSISLIDTQRQWFKSRVGLDSVQTPRETAFCAHAILDPGRTLVVEDARQDARFRDNPYVLQAPNIRFYAGAPLVVDGQPIGTLCVMDDEPRRLTAEQVEALEALSRQASLLLDLRRLGSALNLQLAERAWYENQLRAQQVELEARNADLTEQTRTDPLTGLANRRAFAVAVQESIAAAGGRPGWLWVAMIDIDHFKTINDVHGHPEGDRVLQAVAYALRPQGAARGRVARYGGEEFVVLLPDMARAQAELQCEFMRQSIADAPIGLPITASIGLAALAAGDTPEALLARADAALYAAKRGGRDRVAVDAAAAGAPR